jgi:peptidoglycan/xylan/chitin deacetylase (PgdA/CDA1 family)
MKVKIYVTVAGFIVLVVAMIFLYYYYYLPAEPYIAKFEDNKEAALSLTFDDGCPSVFSEIVPALDKRGFKATFYINAQLEEGRNNWDKWLDILADGHEIGNHSWSHIRLDTVTDEVLLRREINYHNEFLESKLGYKPLTFAYPYNESSDLTEAIVAERHIACRSTLRAKNVDYQKTWDPERTFEAIDRAIDKHRFLSFNAHGVGDCWEPMTVSYFSELLEYIAAKADRININTFKRLSMYHIERLETTVHTFQVKNRKYIALKTRLDTALYNLPLTVIIPDAKKKIFFSDPQPDAKRVGNNYLVKIRPGSFVSYKEQN